MKLRGFGTVGEMSGSCSGTLNKNTEHTGIRHTLFFIFYIKLYVFVEFLCWFLFV